MISILNFYFQIFSVLCMFYGMYKFASWAGGKLDKFIFTNKKIDELDQWITDRLN